MNDRAKELAKGYDATRRKKPGFKNKVRRYQLMRLYGITPEQYEGMLVKQDARCAICLRTSLGRLCVDHNHTTGKVRGLLCQACNRALGLMGDSSGNVARAASYLARQE